ncbi:MAG TPA: hypothetical protein VLA09_05195, partial [Longimicrobiales bacterium]|nr:hypothetical protein [Longimicrobiales bacterium]
TRADGSGGTYQLTGPPFDEFQPTWSPRGDLVAFASTRGSGTDVWTVPRMRGAWRNLTNDGAAYSPSWSPDGRLIAYVSQKYGTPDIFTVEVNTLAKKLVVGDPSEDIDPTWRPDSRAIAFASDRDGDFDIYTIGLAGGAPHNVTNTSHRDVHPVFAPDGSRIAFETHRSDVFGDVYDMFPSGSTQWPLPNQLGPEIADIQPDWR